MGRGEERKLKQRNVSLYNPKGYFQLSGKSPPGSEGLGRLAQEKGKGFSCPLLSLPAQSREALQEVVIPWGWCPLRVLGLLLGHPSVSLYDWPPVGFDSKHHFQRSFVQSKLPTESTPFLPPPQAHPDGPTDTHSRKDQGGRSCGDERVGGQRAAGGLSTVCRPLPAGLPAPSALRGPAQSPLFVQAPSRPSPSLSLPLAGPLGPQ